jgi:copper chaperone
MMNFGVEGMSCGHCVRSVTTAIQAIDPAAKVEVDLGSKSVAVESSLEPAEVAGAIEKSGYAVIRRDLFRASHWEGSPTAPAVESAGKGPKRGHDAALARCLRGACWGEEPSRAAGAKLLKRMVDAPGLEPGTR